MNILKAEIQKSTQNISNWSNYLDCVSRNFKYSFTEQLLINNQKPNATAVANYDTWNERLGRIVKTGTAMYVPVVQNGKRTVKTFFDITDTIETSNSKPIPQWAYKAEHKEPIAEYVINKYNLTDIVDTSADVFGGIHSDVIDKITMEYIQNNIESINKSIENSAVYDDNPDDKYQREADFFEAVYLSVALVVNKRLGIGEDANTPLTNMLGGIIQKFNTEAIITELGNAVSTLSDEYLRTVEIAVKTYNKEQEKQAQEAEKQTNNHELQNIQNKESVENGQGVHSSINSEHEVLRAESNNEGRVGQADRGEVGGGDESGGYGVQSLGVRRDMVYNGASGQRESNIEMPVSQHSDGRGGGVTSTEQMGFGEEELLGGNQQLSVEGNDGTRISQPLPRDRKPSQRTKGTFDKGNTQKPSKPSDRAGQSPRPDGMGGQDEQLPSPSPRDNLQQPDLQLITEQLESEQPELEQPESQQIESTFAPILEEDLGAFSMQKIPPMFVVNWDNAKHDFDLNQYEDSDMIAYDKDGVSFKLNKIGDINFVSSTTRIAPFGEILGDNDIPGYIRQQMKDYRNGDIIDEQVREQTLKRLESYLKIEEAPHKIRVLSENQHVENIDDVEFVFTTVRRKRESQELLASETKQSTNNSSVLSEKHTSHSTVKPSITKPPVSKNFRMDDFDYANMIGGGAKSKFKRNVEAIRTLKVIEAESRTATPEEQKTLAHYVGCGSIQEAFQLRSPQWQEEYEELKELLSPREYEAARASILTAYYTEPTIMNAMWNKLEELGNFLDYGDNLKNLNVLEPSMGIGNFYATAPEHIINTANMHGVEIDSISGRIAKQLFPNVDIQVKGFEKTGFDNDFFDIAIGNVPFSESIIPVDWRYDKEKLLIHDYFFCKTLDKIRPGGVIAFITSAGTLDKLDGKARSMIAERAELLGAIRLPSTAFKENAGTEVVSDIVFLQKREEPKELTDQVKSEIINNWMGTSKNNGITEKSLSNYFINNPHMILGEYKKVSGRYGMQEKLMPKEETSLSEQLQEAMKHITGTIPIREVELDLDEDLDATYILYDDERAGFYDKNGKHIYAKNNSFAVVEDEVYYRENNRLNIIDAGVGTTERIKGLVSLRTVLHDLIQAQVDDRPLAEIEHLQDELNTIYDEFSKKHGLVTSRANSQVFDSDDSYYLLASLEKLNDEFEFVGKSDIFTKRTIKPHIEITSVDTSSEALAVSIGYRGKVDLDYMAELTGFDKQKIINDLEGVIFSTTNEIEHYVTADEYLSGNVRQKLERAKSLAEIDPRFDINVAALEKAQPVDLEAHEIYVRLGTTWIDKKYVQMFMNEILETPLLHRDEIDADGNRKYKWEDDKYAEKNKITVQYSSYSNEWRITNKNAIHGENIKANIEYGTSAINAYHILEQTLNLKDIVIKETIKKDGKEFEIVNEEQTALARQKQEDLKNAFKEWIFKEPTRRENLVALYNEKFNAIRPREYDGSHITFGGMNAGIKLEKHQIDAVARIMYGGNTLLAHEVGAGKSFEMIAAAMESKRVGLCNKSLLVVPKHLTGQMASEFLRLYPNANILVATDKTFETKNRKKFCGKIATGNYDAVIMGHTQFEMIKLSKENQEKHYSEQFDFLVEAIKQAKDAKGGYFTVKQMENVKNKVQSKLASLFNDKNKDDVITFEQLGIDKMFIDEAHEYKNLQMVSKMNNVAGIAQTRADKTDDMFMKVRYLDKETDGTGIIFASGTPISNSLVEMYTMMRYLQYDKLEELGLEHFDKWASMFTEPKSNLELAPEGTGYKMRTRCDKFYNLPELMNIFFEVADIKTAESLNLPRPEANFHTITCEPTELQKEMVGVLSERADRVRSKAVKKEEDNMLAITNDGRKLGLDQRVVNSNLPDDPKSKVNIATENVFNIWEKTKADKSTQIIFCDLSTPSEKNRKEHGFNIYDDMKKKLIENGIPEKEIAFIHDYNSDKQKQKLFANVRSGKIRVVFGSTGKMGAGTNVQDRLIALHHIDCPWKPSDLTQREGRILRRGNQNETVDIYKYVTKDTFDAYLYQTLEKKQAFISQIMTEKSPVRTMDDIDQSVLNYAEIKALCVGNPKIKEKMDLEQDLKRLNALYSQYKKNLYSMESAILKKYPIQIRSREQNMANYLADEVTLNAKTQKVNEGISPMMIKGVTYHDRAKAGEAIKEACKQLATVGIANDTHIGTYRGLDLYLLYSLITNEHRLTAKGEMPYPITLESNFSAQGVVTRLDNVLDKIPEYIKREKANLQNTINQMETAKIEVMKSFPHEAELKKKTARVAELNVELSLDAQKTSSAKVNSDTLDVPLNTQATQNMPTVKVNGVAENKSPTTQKQPQSKQTETDAKLAKPKKNSHEL